MKKILSILMSVLMVASVLSVSVVPAIAKTYGSQESTTEGRKITVDVNGQGSNDVTYKVDDKDKNKITFTYDGDGNLEGWDFGDLVENVDYVIVSQDGNSITIRLLNPNADITANAIVKENEGGETTKPEKTTVKPDNGGTSPATGASLAGVAVAGAGVAMLLALKKKDDAE